MQPVSLAWLWQNETHSDVELRVCYLPRVGDAGSAAKAGISQTTDTITLAPHSSPQQPGSNNCDQVGAPVEAATAVSTSAAAAAATPAALAPLPCSRSPGGGPCVRTFQVHTVVLASSGSYFQKRLEPQEAATSSKKRPRDDSSETATALPYADGRSEDGSKVLLIQHVAEGELGAFEAVLRHCYTGSLTDAGDDPAQLSVALLLQVATLADSFDIQQCALRSCQELATRGAAAYDLAACDAVLSSLPPGLQGLPAIRTATAAATQRLLQLLGDCEAVCGALYDAASTLDKQLRQLSLPAVLALLGSDALQARSENSVLVMAAAWVAGKAGRACGAAQRRQVAEVLRLGRLSRAFTFDVLPALPWLQLSDAEHRSLLRFSAAGPEAQGQGAAAAALTPLQEDLRGDKQLAGPDVWYRAFPRATWAGPAHLLLHWEVPQVQLEAALVAAAAPRTTSRRCFFNGLVLQMELFLPKASGGGGVAGVCHVGHTAQVWLQGCMPRRVPLMNVQSRVRFGVLEAGAGGGGGGGAAPNSWRLAGASMSSNMVSQQPLFPKVVAALLPGAAAWAPYLVEGRVVMQMMVLRAE